MYDYCDYIYYSSLLRSKTGGEILIDSPYVLYAIEEIATGKVIFNARGGCYKEPKDVAKKLKKLGGTNNYRIIVYKRSNYPDDEVEVHFVSSPESCTVVTVSKFARIDLACKMVGFNYDKLYIDGDVVKDTSDMFAQYNVSDICYVYPRGLVNEEP